MREGLQSAFSRAVLMRCLQGVGLAVVLSASPAYVQAQEAQQEPETATDSLEPVADQWRHPHDRRTRPEESGAALELELDASGLAVAPPPEPEDPEVYLRRARAGLIGSSIAVGAGAALLVGSALYVGDSGSSDGSFDFTVDLGPNIAMGTFGAILTAGGLVGLGISGRKLRDAKRQLSLYSVGRASTAEPPAKLERYKLQELEDRKRRAALGLIGPATIAVIGIGPLVSGFRGSGCRTTYDTLTQSKRCENLRIAGGVLVIVGGLGVLTGGIIAGVRKGQVRRKRKGGGPDAAPRIQWDFARSQLVF